MSGLGLLGGTFDPPHFGHLILAECALRELKLKKVIFIPANIPPHKTEKSITAGKIRLEMLKIAIRGYKDCEISETELKRNKTSYTIDTLKEFRDLYPDDKIFFLIGADNVAEMETWHKPDEIIKIARIAVAERPGYKPLGKYEPFLTKFKMDPIDISSTEIRNRLKDNRSVDGMLPDDLITYIKKNRLYI